MALNSQDFHILDTLDTEEITSQRQLSEHTGISLGQINYVLKRLLEKGLVKIGNFKRNPKKFEYAYLLTPKGIETKSRLAVRFVLRKLEEYGRVQDRIAEKLGTMEGEEEKRFVFIGPETVCDLIKTIIESRGFNLELVDCLEDTNDLSTNPAKNVDAILLFNEEAVNLNRIANDTGLSKDRFIPLW